MRSCQKKEGEAGDFTICCCMVAGPWLSPHLGQGPGQNGRQGGERVGKAVTREQEEWGRRDKELGLQMPMVSSS